MSRLRRGHIVIAALYLGLAMSLTSFHAFQVNFGPKEDKREVRHERIVELDRRTEAVGLPHRSAPRRRAPD